MALYDSFGIKFIKKNGVNTYFEFNNNASTNDNIAKLAEVFCLFTVGLFETDSVERKVVYKKNGKYFVDKIDNLCKAYFTNRFYEGGVAALDGATFFEHCDGVSEIIGHKTYYSSLKNIFGIGSFNASKLFVEDESESDSDSENYDYNSESSNDNKSLNVKPGVKLVITKHTYTAKADISIDDDKEAKDYELWNTEADWNIVPDKIYDISKEIEEVPGNWGDRIVGKVIEKDIVREERCSIFDLDKFSIEAKITLDLLGCKKYECSFTPINGVHHAASMFAQSCTVDYTKTTIESKLINTVIVKFVPREDVYDVVTTYLGVDVL